MRDAALIIIDLQNDFCPGGALAVAGGDEIVPVINSLQPEFGAVALTQDWHPADHFSFAGRHPGAAPFSVIEAPYGPQTLWPAHCVQGGRGAELHPDLDMTRAEMILRKGFRREIDSYSAFFENDRATSTGLAGWLRARGLSKLALCGLATDFCVAWSAIDAARLGFETHVLMRACRGIDLDGSMEAARRAMTEAGVTLDES